MDVYIDYAHARPRTVPIAIGIRTAVRVAHPESDFEVVLPEHSFLLPL